MFEDVFMGKFLKVFFTIAMIILVICIIERYTQQDRVFDIKTIAIDEDEQAAILGRIEYQVIGKETRPNNIDQFAVSGDEMIATYSASFLDVSGNHKYINVYDKTGKFQYGCRFQTHTGEFLVDWDENLKIYAGGMVLELNSLGECIEVRYIDPSDTTFSAFKNVSSHTKKKVNGVTYKLEWFSKIARIDDNGKNVIIS